MCVSKMQRGHKYENAATVDVGIMLGQFTRPSGAEAYRYYILSAYCHLHAVYTKYE